MNRESITNRPLPARAAPARPQQAPSSATTLPAPKPAATNGANPNGASRSRNAAPHPKGTPHPDDIHVGRMIRQRRVMLELSQTELGNKLGVAFQQVQKYEKGTNRVSASRLVQIARCLDVPITYFFPADEAVHRPDPVTITSAAAVRMLQHFQAIRSERTRSALAAVVAEIAEREALAPDGLVQDGLAPSEAAT